MAITWTTIKEWRPAPLDTAEGKLNTAKNDLLGLADELATMGVPTNWRGSAASAAQTKLQSVTDDLEDLVAEISAAQKATSDAADGVRGVEQAVSAATEFATKYDLTIGADGSVTSPPDRTQYSSDHEAKIATDIRQGHVDECAARIRAALRKARDVDSDYGAVLSKIDTNSVDGGSKGSLADAAEHGVSIGDLSMLTPPVGGTPAENAAWWSSLSKDERDEIIRQHPGWIGNLDGVDFTSRDLANRNLLDDHERDLLKQREELLKKLTPEERAAYELGKKLPEGAYTDDLTRLDAKIASLNKVKQLAELPDHKIIGLDFSCERAQAIIGQGDLDNAKKVAVFTPGLTSTVDGIGGNDTNMANLRKLTAQQLVQDMTREQIDAAGGYEAAMRQAMKDVAVVTWLDYQAPQIPSIGDVDLTVAGHDAARTGGKDLANFFRGINTSRADDPDLTALGHSYGSVTTAYALHQSTGVDRAAIFGSPGLAAADKTDLQINPDHLWQGEAKGDLVADAGRFGRDPTYLEGIKHFSTTESGSLHGSEGHSDYLTEKSTSQYNLANIVAGQEGDVIQGNEKDRGDLHWFGLPDTPDTPEIKIPATPEIRTPDVHIPKVDGPTIDLPFTDRNITLPGTPQIDIDIPDIPSIDLPDIPSWDTPDISDLPDPRHEGGIELDPRKWFK